MDRLIEHDDMGETAWGRLLRGARDPESPFHLLTLATVTLEGQPSARLMVNRGADRRSGLLWFHSGRRSPKVAQVRANPWACVVGFDTSDGVEVRMNGTVTVHDHGALADRHWEQMTETAREFYRHHDDRHHATAGTDPRLPFDPEELAAALTERARANFAVLELAVETIDWYQVLDGRQRRALLRSVSAWRAEPQTA